MHCGTLGPPTPHMPPPTHTQNPPHHPQDVGAAGSPHTLGFAPNTAASYFAGGNRRISDQSLAVLQRLQRSSDVAGTSSGMSSSMSSSYGTINGYANGADARWGTANGFASGGYGSPTPTMQGGASLGRDGASYAAVVAAPPLSPQHLGNAGNRSLGLGLGADAPWQGALSPPRGDGGPLSGGGPPYSASGMASTMGMGFSASLGKPMTMGGSIGMGGTTGIGTSAGGAMDLGASMGSEQLMAASLARLDPVKQARLEISMREGFRSVHKMLKNVGAMLGDDVEDARAVAATRIQAIVRGWMVRARYKKALWAMKAWRRREFGPVRALLLGWVRRRDDLVLHMQAMQAVRQKRTLKKCYYSWLRLVVDARAATSALLRRALAMAEKHRRGRMQLNFKKWREIASGPNSRLNLLLRHERRSREAIERLRSMARETGWSGSISREMVRRELHNEAETIIRALVQRNAKRRTLTTWAGWVRLRAIVRSMSLQTLQRERSGYCTKVFAAFQMAVRDRQQQWGPYWPRRRLWVAARRKGRIVKLRFFFSQWAKLGTRALKLRRFRQRQHLRTLSLYLYRWREALRLNRQTRRQVIDKWIAIGRATDLQPVKRWRMAVMEAKVLRRAQERAAENMRRRRTKNLLWEHFCIWRGRLQSKAAAAAGGNPPDASGSTAGTHFRGRRVAGDGGVPDVALLRSDSLAKDSKAALAAITAELSSVNQRLATVTAQAASSSGAHHPNNNAGAMPGATRPFDGASGDGRRYVPPPSGGTDADEELRRLYRMVDSISGRLNELISEPPPTVGNSGPEEPTPAPVVVEPLPVVNVPAPAVTYGSRPAVQGGVLGDPLLRAMCRRTLPPSPLSQAGANAHR
eukprot:jgi/Mesvir1/22810/Mv14222-RA.2